MPTREQEHEKFDDHVLRLNPLERLYFRVAHHNCEVRIWGEYHRYTYEVVSSGEVIARGIEGSGIAALERTIPLFNVLNRLSDTSAPLSVDRNCLLQSVKAGDPCDLERLTQHVKSQPKNKPKV